MATWYQRHGETCEPAIVLNDEEIYRLTVWRARYAEEARMESRGITRLETRRLRFARWLVAEGELQS